MSIAIDKRLVDEADLARLYVATAEETRRRIQRDVHDGAQQRLVHTVLTLKLAKAALAGAGGTVAELIDDALENAERATAELRDLVHGVTPVIGRGGLRAGIEAFLDHAGVPVSVDVPDERLPAAVETTAYFIVAEALTNVVKHARASGAHVRAVVDGDVLELEVRDDGTGGADSTHGSGLAGLRDRVEARGGTIHITSPPGRGTTISITLPIEHPHHSAGVDWRHPWFGVAKSVSVARWTRCRPYSAGSSPTCRSQCGS